MYRKICYKIFNFCSFLYFRLNYCKFRYTRFSQYARDIHRVTVKIGIREKRCCKVRKKKGKINIC